MQRKLLRQNPTEVSLSKKAVPRQRGQAAMSLRVEVMELCEGAGLYQIDLLNGSKERVSEAEYWARRRGQQKLDLANAALTVAGQQPRQKKFETVKDTLRKQISSVLYRTTSFEDWKAVQCGASKARWKRQQSVYRNHSGSRSGGIVSN